MTTIEIDFDVFKALTTRRASETTSYNDVLRELLGLPPIGLQRNGSSSGPGWTVENVTFPEGTEFRALFKGQEHRGRVVQGGLVVNGSRFGTPSAAAVSLAGYAVNGWRFWECKRPGDTNWLTINSLRRR